MTHLARSHQPVSGLANEPDLVPLLDRYHEPQRLEKRGWLYLLTRGVDASQLSELYSHYYSRSSFDIVPALQDLLTVAWQKVTPDQIPLALVVHGLSVVAVGSSEASIWLTRYGQQRELFPGGIESQELPQSAIIAAADTVRLFALHRRLTTGDSLMIATHRAMGRLSPARIRHAASFVSHPKRAAEYLSRHARAAESRAPVIVVHVPGLSAVPELGPATSWHSAEPIPPAIEPRRGPSPIWGALAFAVILLGFAAWWERDALSSGSLKSVVTWMLTPMPTETSAVVLHTPQPPPTVTPGTVQENSAATPVLTVDVAEEQEPLPTTTASPISLEYASPELHFPEDEQRLTEADVTFRWVWSGALSADEYFDVRLWREGEKPKSLAWTKDRSYLERSLSLGWYYWTVVVVRGGDGTIESELSEMPEPISFHIGEKPQPVPTASATQQPTAVPRPTRVTPSLP